MLKPAQPVYMPPKSEPNSAIGGAISRGMAWVDGAILNHAKGNLPIMPDDKQALIWHSVKGDPMALQSYIYNLGTKAGITDHAGLDKLASDYIASQSTKFGG